MANSLYLPASEDTEVSISFGGQSEILIDIFELEELFIAAENKAQKMSTTWKQEFPAIFKKKTGHTINASQSILLWEGIKEKIDSLKKSLLNASTDFSKPESPSPRKRKKK